MCNIYLVQLLDNETRLMPDEATPESDTLSKSAPLPTTNGSSDNDSASCTKLNIKPLMKYSFGEEDTPANQPLSGSFLRACKIEAAGLNKLEFENRLG